MNSMRRKLNILYFLVVFNFLCSLQVYASKGLVGILDEISATLDRFSNAINSFFISNKISKNEELNLKPTKQTPVLDSFLGSWERKIEQKLGKDVHEALRQKPGFSNNRYYLDRVARVARRLVPHCERKDLTYRFAVLKSNEVNAFAAPGGFVYVTEGLLRIIESDDELACVIAHELGHINKKHTIRQAEKAGILAILVYIMGLNDEAKKYQNAAAIAAYFINQKFSRDDEFEADKMAVIYAYKAGYNPYALVRFFEKINRDNSLTHITKYFSSHPPTSERIKRVKAEINKIQNRNMANNYYLVTDIPNQTYNNYTLSPQISSNNAIENNTSYFSNQNFYSNTFLSINNNNPIQFEANNNTNLSKSHTNKSFCTTINPPHIEDYYEIYIKKKKVYEEKISSQAPQNEIIKAYQDYQNAKKNYFQLKQLLQNKK